MPRQNVWHFSDAIFKSLFLQLIKNTQWISFPNELWISSSRQTFTLFNVMLVIDLSVGDKLNEILMSTNDYIV